MARTIEAAVIAALLLAFGAEQAEAQCEGTPGCGGVEVFTQPAEPAPAETSPPPAPSRPASGVIIALDILYSPRATMVGGLFTGLYGLTQRFALSLSVGTAGRRDDEDGDHRETPISAGGVFLLTPGAPFRVAIPLRTGVAIHHQTLPDGASKRFAIYTLDAGVSGHLLVHGPAYVGGIIRGQLQVSPWDHQVDFAASFEVDLALLF